MVEVNVQPMFSEDGSFMEATDAAGGQEVLYGCAGNDGTKQFDRVGHSQYARQLLVNFKIGTLPDEERTRPEPQCIGGCGPQTVNVSSACCQGPLVPVRDEPACCSIPSSVPPSMPSCSNRQPSSSAAARNKGVPPKSTQQRRSSSAKAGASPVKKPRAKRRREDVDDDDDSLSTWTWILIALAVAAIAGAITYKSMKG